jgi:hypothetical protein
MSVPERVTPAETPGTEPHVALPRETMPSPGDGPFTNSGRGGRLWSLVIFAVAMVASVLQKLLGAAGTLLTIIVLIVFGNPSSGGSAGVPFLPTVWLDIGPYLPPRNGLTAIHNTMYVNGNGITQALILGI